MCTGRIAFVRSVTAASAASGSRLSVTGSMSANTGRAPSYSAALAEATNENGLVITSSPRFTPTARSARCRPAVPLETALAYKESPPTPPTRRANACSNSPTFGPSESSPERSTSSTARSSSTPSVGRASGIVSSSSSDGLSTSSSPSTGIGTYRSGRPDGRPFELSATGAPSPTARRPPGSPPAARLASPTPASPQARPTRPRSGSPTRRSRPTRAGRRRRRSAPA